nr:unnamed protein product [Callosobruchus analis]
MRYSVKSGLEQFLGKTGFLPNPRPCAACILIAMT